MSLPEYRDVRELRTALSINAAAGASVNAAALLEMLDAAPTDSVPRAPVEALLRTCGRVRDESRHLAWRDLFNEHITDVRSHLTRDDS